MPGLLIVERAGSPGIELLDARLDSCAGTVNGPRHALRRAVPAVAHGWRHAKRGTVQGRCHGVQAMCNRCRKGLELLVHVLLSLGFVSRGIGGAIGGISARLT